MFNNCIGNLALFTIYQQNHMIDEVISVKCLLLFLVELVQLFPDYFSAQEKNASLNLKWKIIKLQNYTSDVTCMTYNFNN